MGIRFLCQHCEKRLNVKTVQAGQHGQCPYCFGKVLVPGQSTIPSELEKQLNIRRGIQRPKDVGDSSIGLHAVDEQITMDGIPAEQRQQAADSVSESLKKIPPDVESDAASEESSAELFMLDKPQLPATMGKIDPIAEAPARIWYFRSRELGERGPLKGKVMREYLDRGDVNVGCIVWREDWNDWLPAEKVFPRLTFEAGHKRSKPRVSRSFKQANYAVPDGFDPQSAVNQRRRRVNQIFWGAVISGVVIILVLLVVLLKLVAENP